MERFHLTFESDPALLGGLRRSLASALEDAGIERPVRDYAVLATHEAAANAIEHSGAGLVDVSAHVEDGVLTIEVADRGMWKEASGAASYDADEHYGLALIEGLVPRVDLDRSAAGTTVRLTQTISV